MELEIKTCSDCPFLSDTFLCCELKAKNENRSICEDDKIEWVYEKGRVVPTWCPLHSGGILIKLTNQLKIVKDTADGIIGISDIQNNEKLYAELNSRVQKIFCVKSECEWKHVDMGMFGCNDYVWKTSCGQEFDSDKVIKTKFCSNCGSSVV